MGSMTSEKTCSMLYDRWELKQEKNMENNHRLTGDVASFWKKLQETHEFSYYYVSSKLQVPVFSEIRSGNYIPQNWSCWVTLTFKHPERWTIWWIYAPKQEADWHMIDKRISPAAANCERTGKACESWNFIIWVGKNAVLCWSTNGACDVRQLDDWKYGKYLLHLVFSV